MGIVVAECLGTQGSPHQTVTEESDDEEKVYVQRVLHGSAYRIEFQTMGRYGLILGLRSSLRCLQCNHTNQSQSTHRVSGGSVAGSSEVSHCNSMNQSQCSTVS